MGFGGSLGRIPGYPSGGLPRRAGATGGGGAPPPSPSTGTIAGAVTLSAVPRQTVAITNVVTASSTNNASTYPTGSISFTSGRLYVFDIVGARNAAGVPALTNVAGATQTFTFVDARSFGTTQSIERWYCVANQTISEAVTADWGAHSLLSVVWSINEITGFRTVTPIRQTVKTNGVAVTTLTTTLAALENANNIHLCTTGIAATAAITHDAAFAELGDDSEISAPLGLNTEWARNVLACTPTWAAVNSAQISSEIVAGP